MEKTVILITGTPCIGKTTVSKMLATKLEGDYFNLTELARKYALILQEDNVRNTAIIDESKMRRKLDRIIDGSTKTTVIIDGHYASAVTAKRKVTRVIVLRRNPIELYDLMVKRGFKDQKLWENLASEILDSSLAEAIREQGEEKVCELDISGKTELETVDDVLAILACHRKCEIGVVDWLGMLESQGKTDDYLKL